MELDGLYVAVFEKLVPLVDSSERRVNFDVRFLSTGTAADVLSRSSEANDNLQRTRRFDPETRAFFGYTSKLSNRPIYTFKLLCLGVATYRAKIVLKK